MTIVLTEAGSTELADAKASGEDLWLTAAAAARASGWTLKPEGLCQGAVCIPVPRTETENFVREDAVNLAAFWRLMGHPVVHDAAGATWMLGTGAASRARALQSLEAPDFRLPDLAGAMHALSDYRGQRVLLTTWSSW